MGYAAANAIGRVYVLEEVVVTAEGAGLTLGGLTLGEAAAALGVAALEVLSGPVGWGLLAVGVIAIGYGIYQSTKSEDDSESKPKSGNDDGVQVKDEPAEDAEPEGGDKTSEPRTRGLPPDDELPPGKDPEDLRVGDASRPSEVAKGGKSLWDSDGGEWRYSPEDKWHNPHWDYNPHNAPNSPWENVPLGNLPVYK